MDPRIYYIMEEATMVDDTLVLNESNLHRGGSRRRSTSHSSSRGRRPYHRFRGNLPSASHGINISEARERPSYTPPLNFPARSYALYGNIPDDDQFSLNQFSFIRELPGTTDNHLSRRLLGVSDIRRSRRPHHGTPYRSSRGGLPYRRSRGSPLSSAPAGVNIDEATGHHVYPVPNFPENSYAVRGFLLDHEFSSNPFSMMQESSDGAHINMSRTLVLDVSDFHRSRSRRRGAPSRSSRGRRPFRRSRGSPLSWASDEINITDSRGPPSYTPPNFPRNSYAVRGNFLDNQFSPERLSFMQESSGTTGNHPSRPPVRDESYLRGSRIRHRGTPNGSSSRGRRQYRRCRGTPRPSAPGGINNAEARGHHTRPNFPGNSHAVRRNLRDDQFASERYAFLQGSPGTTDQHPSRTHALDVSDLPPSRSRRRGPPSRSSRGRLPCRRSRGNPVPSVHNNTEARGPPSYIPLTFPGNSYAGRVNLLDRHVSSDRFYCMQVSPGTAYNHPSRTPALDESNFHRSRSRHRGAPNRSSRGRRQFDHSRGTSPPYAPYGINIAEAREPPSYTPPNSPGNAHAVRGNLLDDQFPYDLFSFLRDPSGWPIVHIEEGSIEVWDGISVDLIHALLFIPGYIDAGVWDPFQVLWPGYMLLDEEAVDPGSMLLHRELSVQYLEISQEFDIGGSPFSDPSLFSVHDDRVDQDAGVNMIFERITIPLVSPFMLDDFQDNYLDVDIMSYEELLHLEEQIGDENTGLAEDAVHRVLKRHAYVSLASSEPNSCCICLEEYEDGEDLGMMGCGHDFHVSCIARWLLQKNFCPICKKMGLPI